MAITANIQKVVKDPDGATVVVVQYTDGASFNQTKDYRIYGFDQLSFKRTVQTQIAAFSADASQSLTPGPFDPTIATVPPTQTQLNQQAFQKDWVTLQGALKLVNAGVLNSNDARLAQLRTAVQTEAAQVVTDSDFQTLLGLIP